jgi:hypothetical protein
LKEAEEGLSRNSDTAARRSRIGAGGALNWQARFCCRYAAGAANDESWDNCWLRPGTVGAPGLTLGRPRRQNSGAER